MTTLSLPKCTYIGIGAFSGCELLESLYLTNSVVATLSSVSTFTSTKIGSGDGSIYVPLSLVDSYKSATNWSYFSAVITAYNG
jgi:hypothetical protein